jgi:hypothetical protein
MHTLRCIQRISHLSFLFILFLYQLYQSEVLRQFFCTLDLWIHDDVVFWALQLASWAQEEGGRIAWIRLCVLVVIITKGDVLHFDGSGDASVAEAVAAIWHESRNPFLLVEEVLADLASKVLSSICRCLKSNLNLTAWRLWSRG